MQWHRDLGARAQHTSTPVIGSDGSIIVAANDKRLIKLDLDGELIWNREWSYPVMTSLPSSLMVGPDGTIFTGGFDNLFRAVNPDSTDQWEYPAGSFVMTPPALTAAGLILVGITYENSLLALEQSGELAWSFATAGKIYAAPAVDADGVACFADEAGVVYAVNPDGSLRWSYQAGDMIMSSPAIGGTGRVYIGCLDGCLYALGSD